MNHEQTAPSALFDTLSNDIWAYRLRTNPLFATHVGEHAYDDQLPDPSPAGADADRSADRAFLERLQALPPDQLTPADRLNHAILTHELTDRLAQHAVGAYRLPLRRFADFYSQFIDLPRRQPLNTVDDYERYLGRLTRVGRYFDGYIATLRDGLRVDMVPPRLTLRGVSAELTAYAAAAPEASPLFTPFTSFPPTVDAAAQNRLRAAGLAAMRDVVLPAYERLRAFIDDEYAPATRDEDGAQPGIGHVPGGAAFYAQSIRHYTTVDLSADAVHILGRSEVARLKEEMRAAQAATGFRGAFTEFVAHMRAEPRFYAESPEALLQAVAYVMKRMDGELPRLFGRLPRLPYGIRPIPAAAAPNATTAYYAPGAGDGSRAGIYYVNTHDLASRPLYEIEALSFHEAVPGHHLQIALQQELVDLPPFRRFGHMTAFVEGWALYAERLGLDVGFYTDPYSNFARLSYEMWRACRLVVDTGLHAFGWTRDRAIDFMLAHTSSTRHNIINEVDRYIAWPGQALAYKVGERRVTALRRSAEAALGARFDIRAFHDWLLGSGSMPLDVLEARLPAWLAGGA